VNCDAEFEIPINITFQVVGDCLRKAVVSCGKDSAVIHQDAPDLGAWVFTPEANFLSEA